MATKRPSSVVSDSNAEGGGVSSSGAQSDGPPTSKKTAIIPAVSLGKVSTSEEIDMRVLIFQNKKLVQQLETQKDREDELQKKIGDMEQMQSLHDDTLSTVDRFWAQLDENLKVLLSRMDDISPSEIESLRSETHNTIHWESTTHNNEDLPADQDEDSMNETSSQNSSKKGRAESFVKSTKSNEKSEVEEALSARVSFTTKIMEMLVRAMEVERSVLHDVLAKIQEIVPEDFDWTGSEDNEMVTSLKNFIKQVAESNDRLTAQVNSLHIKFNGCNAKMLDAQDKLVRSEEENEELKERIEDLEHDLCRSRQKADKFERLLVDALQNGGKPLSRTVDPTATAAAAGNRTPGNANKAATGDEDGEDYLRSTLSRKEETIESYSQEIANLKKALEEATLDFKNLPEDRITSSAEYKVLQSKFSVIFNENQQLKYQLDEMRNLLQGTKTNHRKHIEQMEKDELSCQKKLRNEVIQLEDTLAQVRKEYEMLRNEFEQNMAQNDQTVPINKEITQITKTLMSNNSHLKSELSRHKRKLKEAHCEILKLKQQAVEAAELAVKNEANASASTSGTPLPGTFLKSSPTDCVGDENSGGSHSDNWSPSSNTMNSEKTDGANNSFGHSSSSAADNTADIEKSDVVKELRAQLKKSQESCREYKLMLEVYKGASKEQRDKVQLMASERKAKIEVEELKAQLASNSQDSSVNPSTPGPSNSFGSKSRQNSQESQAASTPEKKLTKSHEALIEECKKQLASTKQEEEALLKEMEVTGRAFEDMQEQNKRLIDQLKEKDNANFKLMAERIKANQIQRLLQEEKEVLAEQVMTLQQQVTSQVQVVRRLEDKEMHLMNSYHTIEKEAQLRTQMAETLKKKATESTQTVFEQGLQLEKLSASYDDARKALREKVDEQQEVELALKRKEDELDRLRRKLERQKRSNVIAQADEVLREEIRMYKAQLTCPCCNVNQIDTLLTKCYHVFCNACIKRRYDTRQRKCPKCSHGFGANDFHRIYI